MQGEAHSLDDYGIGTRDWILGILTFPLLLWVLMFAVTGMDGWLQRPASRLRLYLVLLALEAALVALVVWMVVR
jgi:ABC-type transport system involved in cytochrome c biogenesis permease component